MSCWVTPEIAADWWSISIAQVHQGVAEGTIASKHDIGLLFIDVAPDSPQMEARKEVADGSFAWKIGREQTGQQRRKLAA